MRCLARHETLRVGVRCLVQIARGIVVFPFQSVSRLVTVLLGLSQQWLDFSGRRKHRVPSPSSRSVVNTCCLLCPDFMWGFPPSPFLIIGLTVACFKSHTVMGVISDLIFYYFFFFIGDLMHMCNQLTLPLPKFFRTCLFLLSAPRLLAVIYLNKPSSLHPWFNAALVTPSVSACWGRTMGELRSLSFVPVEKLLSNISSAFPQTHSKKYKERLWVTSLGRLLSSGCRSRGGFLTACQLLKF